MFDFVDEKYLATDTAMAVRRCVGVKMSHAEWHDDSVFEAKPSEFKVMPGFFSEEST